MPSPRPTCGDWLRLVRFPLCLSAVADGVGGYLSALPSRADFRIAAPLCVGAASALLYSAGMAWNDVADRERDATLHPHRPIPSGRIRPRAAATLASVLLLGGVLAAVAPGAQAAGFAAATALWVLLYTFALKRWGIAGAAGMALARAWNFGMGMTAAKPFGAWDEMDLLGPAAVGIYAFSLTAASALEERAPRRWAYVLCAGGMLLAAFIPAATATTLLRPQAVFPAWLAALVLWRTAATLKNYAREEIQRSTAWHVRGTIVLAASFVALRANVYEAAAVAAVLPAMLLVSAGMRRDAPPIPAPGLAD